MLNITSLTIKLIPLFCKACMTHAHPDRWAHVHNRTMSNNLDAATAHATHTLHLLQNSTSFAHRELHNVKFVKLAAQSFRRGL